MSAPVDVLAKPRIRLPKGPRTGEQRQWVKCRTCGMVAYYDFVPYSLSSPMLLLGCGHTPIGRRDLGADRISATEAEPLYLRQAAERALARCGGAP